MASRLERQSLPLRLGLAAVGIDIRHYHAIILGVEEAIDGDGQHLKRIKVARQAEAKLVGDEVARNLMRVDAHAVVAYDQVILILG